MVSRSGCWGFEWGLTRGVVEGVNIFCVVQVRTRHRALIENHQVMVSVPLESYKAQVYHDPHPRSALLSFAAPGQRERGSVPAVGCHIPLISATIPLHLVWVTDT